MAAALAAAAMVRLFGLAFLGRPRVPRGAGAHEVSAFERWSMILPAGLTVLLGLFPGPVLRLGTPALQPLVGHAGGADPLPPVRGLGGLVLSAGEGVSAYAPLLSVVLLAVAGGALFWLVRRRSPLPAARGPVWNCGFMDPPEHLPFGDPLTQPGAGGIAQPLRRMLGNTLLSARERVDMPEPGEVRAGRYEAGFTDPTGPLLLAPLAKLRDRLAEQTDRLREFTIRRSLSLSFAALVTLLVLLAWVESR
jgi:hypothetical protein